MATTRKEILDEVEALVDVPSWLAGRLPALLTAAVRKFSKDKPYEFIEDVTGGGANLLDMPTSWDEEFSRITKIVYPYVDEDSSVLEEDAYRPELTLVSTVRTWKIRFPGYSPAATETVRIWYTRWHVCSELSCTIEEGDSTAVANYTAHLVENKKASHFNGLKDAGGLVAADLVDYGSKATEARNSAKGFLETYGDLVGTGSDGVKAAAVAGDMDTDPQYPGASAMTHHTRYRR